VFRCDYPAHKIPIEPSGVLSAGIPNTLPLHGCTGVLSLAASDMIALLTESQKLVGLVASANRVFIALTLRQVNQVGSLLDNITYSLSMSYKRALPAFRGWEPRFPGGFPVPREPSCGLRRLALGVPERSAIPEACTGRHSLEIKGPTTLLPRRVSIRSAMVRRNQNGGLQNRLRLESGWQYSSLVDSGRGEAFLGCRTCTENARARLRAARIRKNRYPCLRRSA
jgi:hypothetical protein